MVTFGESVKFLKSPAGHSAAFLHVSKNG